MNVKYYSYFSAHHPRNTMIVLVVAYVFDVLGISIIWSCAAGGILLVSFKLFTSYRFNPLITRLKIDSTYVYLAIFRIAVKKLPLKNIYLYQRRYHGIDYLVFSPSELAIVTWRDIAKNRKAIVYPVHGDMKKDFPDLFRDIRY